MKNQIILMILVIAFTVSCREKEPLKADQSGNSTRYRNTAFHAYEDLTSPKFNALKEKYRLDTVFDATQDEFTRQLLLRNWIRTVIRIADFEPFYPGNDVAENILDEALKGQGYHCGHYMIVQNAVMNAYGFVTRCLGAGPGVKGGPDGHHGVNEIWSNQFRKWYLSDAKYNHHFEKSGVPLSALEIRDEFLRNKAADIVLVKGPSRTSIEEDGVANVKGEMMGRTKEDFARTYTWISFESYNDRYTNWPASSDHVSILTMYEDDFFRNNTWIRDGKPHWAYKVEGHLIRVSDRHAIEWTPNTIESVVEITGNLARIALDSETPNLKTYQMKKFPEGAWHDIDSAVELVIDGDRQELLFRTVNLAGVSGPEHRVAIARVKE